MNELRIGTNWDDLKKEIFTQEELAQCDAKVAIIGQIRKAREDKKISQREVAAISGVQQPIIARMEKGSTKPQLDTVLKVMAALGLTLKVVPIEEEKESKVGA